MRNNNKGFTLIELLAIVILLAVIAIIAAPNMTREIRRSEEENQNILNQKIDNASHLYASKYYANQLVNGQQIEFTLNDLQSDGLIDLKSNCSNNLEDTDTIIINSGVYNYDNIKSDDDTCYEE